ncbi:MAG: glycoside hydrolase family 28 protein [Tidjanibacter sp.]|nr:glycoside hydrolase family 28 protein [Tidjanibacter sp.]
MKPLFRTLIVALCGLLTVGCCGGTTEKEIYSDLPFEMPQVERPDIPNREVSVCDFGGVGDGVSLNTEAFAKAFAHLSEKGGGRVVVPAGVWLTGPIVLENHTELHLSEDAIIVFSADRDLYPVIETIFEGRNTYRCQPLLSAFGKHDVAVTGKGIIDGQGDPWRAIKQSKIAPSDWSKKVKSGGVLSSDKKTWYPTENYKLGAGDADQNIARWAVTKEDFESIRDFLRPVMVNFKDCQRVLLEGPVFQNSPCWNIHIAICEDLTVNDIAVRCPWYAQNGDGIDIESCKNVLMTNSWIDAGDDAICIKSGKDEDGRKRGIPCENVIVKNCICYHGHGGFVVGSEMSGGVKNVYVKNCRFSGTDVGLRFKSTRGRGGVVENIYIEDVVMNDIATEALLFDLFYGGKSALEALEDSHNGEPSTDMVAKPVDETTPQFRNFYVDNVVCRSARRAMLFNGLPEMNVENVEVRNSVIEAEIGAEINESTNVLLENVKIVPRKGAALKINNAKDVVVRGFLCPEGMPEAVKVTGSRNRNITISSPTAGADNANIVARAAEQVRFE